MSAVPEDTFDLEKLFLPAWAQEAPSPNRYAKYTGNEGASRGFEDKSGKRRPPRGDRPRQGDFPPQGDRRPQRAPQGQRPGSGPRPDRPPGASGDRGKFARRDRHDNRRDLPPRQEMAPLPEINVTLMPDEKGVDSISRQIKMSGRSFPLFDIAQMILQKPERQQVRFEVKKKADGQPAQALCLCALDDTLWLSEEEAVAHVLEKHFGTFYQTEKTPTDPPKGTYTFVAQCGMSGVILGPPNYHDYQNQLRNLHAERFSRMPFEAFKSRVKIVKEEAAVKKWIEEQSFKTEYICLNLPETVRKSSREEVEKHFREVHLPNIIKPVESHNLTGHASRQLRSPGLQRLLRFAWEQQKKFPLQVATILSQKFASHGLHFFKVNKTVTHVSVARPQYLDLETTPVSEQIRRIVQFINTTLRCSRRRLLQGLAPAAKPAEGAAPAPGAAPAEAEPTPEQAAIIGDLHWLIHQGHVIEFANGHLETAKKPLPRPPKPPKAEPKATVLPEAVAPEVAQVALPSLEEESPAAAPEPKAVEEPTTEPTHVPATT